MKNKYVMIGGFAFSEHKDMRMLSGYAKEGWILDGIVGGFFYRLRKDISQDIIYSLDYQSNADDEYFNLFEEAGWNKVISMDNQIHIFSAKQGTAPIYSDKNTEIDKYKTILEKMKKWAIGSFIAGIILLLGVVFSDKFMDKGFYIFVVLFFIALTSFICSFMAYLAFKSKIKELNR